MPISPWDDWTFWQYDGNGGQTLPNGRDCDFNVFNGTLDELEAFAGLRPPMKKGPPPVPIKARILEAQRLLNKMHYFVGAEDGLLGPRTRAGIAAFQRDQYITVDGQFSDNLLTQLGLLAQIRS